MITSAPPAPSIVSAPDPPVIVFAPAEPRIVIALPTRLASTFEKPRSVVGPDVC